MISFITTIFLIFCFQKILCFKPYGEYYIENEGLRPPVIKSKPISYNSTLVQSKYNKVISVSYYFSRRVGPLGLYVTFQKVSDGISGQVKNSGVNEIKIDNLCNTDLHVDPFWERFTGVPDDECCIKAGHYNLTEWTFEDHFKIMVKEFFYEKYIVHICFTETKDDHVNCILEHDMVIIYKDLDLKKFAAKGRESGRDDKAKQRSNKNKGK